MKDINTETKKDRRTTVRLPTELFKRLKHFSVEADKSMAKIMVEAIDKYLNKETQ